MFTLVNLSRCAGTLCLIWVGVLTPILPAFAEETAAAVCDDAWHAKAEQRATEGLELEQGYQTKNRVLLWRWLVLGEGEPDPIAETESAFYRDGPFLPEHFPDDPEVARVLGLINDRNPDEAITAIEALTHIPDPANTDIATERLLVRSELLFAGVLWTTGWNSSKALKWMALLDAHFLSLPLSILNHDLTVNGAYWRAVDDLDWFGGGRLELQGQGVEDWWLPNTQASLGVAAGVAEAARESPLLDWLQTMAGPSRPRPWIHYLALDLADSAFANAHDHATAAVEQSGSLPWQIAGIGSWTPALRGNPGAMRTSTAQSRLVELERRAKTCALTTAEQYALGPLRFHDARIRAVDQAGYSGWDGAIDPAEAATASDSTRREIARFAIAMGQPKIGWQFQSARDPKAIADSYSGQPLQALAAPDLETFAASDPDSAALNLLPVRILAKLVEKRGLRPDLRAAVARMAWTRAYLLDDTETLKRITPLVGETNASLTPLLDAYQAAWTESGRRKAALALLLRAPGMQLALPDSEDLFWGVDRFRPWLTRAEDLKDAVFKSDHMNPNDNNWWCPLNIDRQLSRMRYNFYDQPLALHADFSEWLQRKLDAYRDQVLHQHAILSQIDYEELGRLAKMPSGSVYLAQAATEWARSSWWWDRYFQGDEMADALARSIQATRWGCRREGQNGAASNAAWRALHDLFPESAASKNSSYWYN
jgi:hypothetical protein